jgi:hypothetical protein
VRTQKELIAMFKNALLPILLAAVVAGTVAVALLLYLTGSDAGPRRNDDLIHSRFTYDEARAILLRSPRWHFTDSPSCACCWVTRQPRQARELQDVVLVQDLHNPTLDRRGIVRVQPVCGAVTTILLDEADTSYWCVVGTVHLAGDPDLVREVVAYLLDDSEP